MTNKENERLLTQCELDQACEKWEKQKLPMQYSQAEITCQIQDAKTRRETLKEVGNYFWKNLDTDFSFTKFATKLKNGEMPVD